MKNILFFAVFLIVVLVSTVLLSVSFYNDEISIAENAAKTELKMITEAVANDLNYILSDSGRDLVVISSMFEYKEIPSSKKFNSIFNNFFKTNSYLMCLWFMDKNGIIRNTVPNEYKEEPGNDYSFRDYFQKAKSGQKVFSDVIQNAKIKGTEKEYESIVIAVPVLDPNDKFFGVVGADISIDQIENKIQTEFLAKVPTKTGLFFVDLKNSRIIAGPKKRKKSNVEFEKFIVNLSHNTNFKEAKTSLETFQGKKYFIAGSEIKNPAYSFGLIGVFPYEETMAYLPNFYSQAIWLLVAVVLIIFMALVFVIYNEKIRKKLQKRITTLEICIGEQEKQQAVTEVIDSEYFKKLESKIKALKKK